MADLLFVALRSVKKFRKRKFENLGQPVHIVANAIPVLFVSIVSRLLCHQQNSCSESIEFFFFDLSIPGAISTSLIFFLFLFYVFVPLFIQSWKKVVIIIGKN